VTVNESTQDLELLSKLIFSCGDFSQSDRVASQPDILARFDETLLDSMYQLDLGRLEELRLLAHSNHVVVRAFRPLQYILAELGKNDEAHWVSNALANEAARIQKATGFLSEVCTRLADAGCPVTVIKSLDHWPDLGSDLDLYSGEDPRKVVKSMQTCFQATPTERSWGDRLAGKWNFEVPGLPELVEIHVGRLGQTGEQTAVTISLMARSCYIDLNGYTFRVAAPEDRIVVSTLQRMYRHFYIRLCDIVDNANLLVRGVVDFNYLRDLGSRAGLWDGIATYLKVVADYVEAYGGGRPDFPSFVTECARLNLREVTYRRQFLRIPIVPHAMALYAAELKNLLRTGDLRNSLRLSLMPGLATAAALGQRITGSDKGIW